MLLTLYLIDNHSHNDPKKSVYFSLLWRCRIGLPKTISTPNQDLILLYIRLAVKVVPTLLIKSQSNKCSFYILYCIILSLHSKTHEYYFSGLLKSITKSTKSVSDEACDSNYWKIEQLSRPRKGSNEFWLNCFLYFKQKKNWPDKRIKKTLRHHRKRDRK